MANEQGRIDEIIGSEAIKGLDLAIERTEKLWNEFSKLPGVIRLMNDTLSKSGSGGGNGLRTTVKDLDELSKMNMKVIDTAQKVEAAYSDVNYQLQQQQLRLKEANKEQRLKVQYNQAEAGSINELRAKLSQLQGQYDAMGKVARDAFGPQLLQRIQAVDKELKALENSTGRFGRSVGNYTQATFALSQVLREMPAFAYGLNVGIMALSNNLPILLDQFRGLSKELGSSRAAMSQMVKSIFSLTNIFTIAIAVLAIWGKDIMEFIRVNVMGGNSIDYMAEAHKRLVAALEQTQSGIAAYEELVVKVDAASKGLVSQEEVLRLYNSTIGAANGEVKTFAEVQAKMIELGPQYVDFLLAQAQAELQIADALKIRASALTLLSKAEKGQVGIFDKDRFKFAFDQAGAGGLFSAVKLSQFIANLFAPDDVITSAVKQAGDAEMKAFEKAMEEARDNYKKMIENNSQFFQGPGKPDKKGPKKKKPQTPLQIEIENYENDLQLLLRQYNTHQITYGDYQLKLYELALKYSEKRIQVSKKEQDEYLKFLNSLSADMGQAGVNFTKAIATDAANNVKGASAEIKKHAEEYLKRFNELLKDTKVPNLNITGIPEDREVIKDRIKALITLGQEFAQGLGTVSDALLDREMQIFDIRDRRLAEYYDNELRFIEQSGLSQEEKEKRKQRLDADTEAKRKQIDRDRIAAQIKYARFQKQADIAGIIASTALAIMRTLAGPGDPVTKGILVAGVGVTGLAQLAKVIATPIPQYAKGRGKGRDEFALTGEAGPEVIVRGSGGMEVVDKPTITWLNRDDMVLNKEQIMQNIQKAAYVRLTHHDKITTDTLQAALLAAFEENTNEIRTLQKITARNKPERNSVFPGYDQYLKSQIK